MKICIVSPYPPVKDGIGIFSEKIVRLLRKQNNEVLVLSTPFGEVKQDSVFRWVSFSVSNILKSIRLIRKEKADIIHVQYAIATYGIYSFPLLCFLLYLRFSGFKNIVATYHEVKRDNYLLGFVGIMYYRLFSKLFSSIFIHTREAEKILINACGVSSSKIHVIPHGLYEFQDTHDYQQELKEKYNIANIQVILYFGFIHVDKGIQHLIRAIAHLKEANPALVSNMKVLIVGSVRERKGLFRIFELKDKQYFDRLLKLVNENKLSSEIQFIGHIEEKYIYSLFKLSKIVVLPYEKVE